MSRQDVQEVGASQVLQTLSHIAQVVPVKYCPEGHTPLEAQS
jgi:hypothetical protein